MIAFKKYHGAGNDFILIDDRENRFDENNSNLIHAMCDRHFGIGADGLMLLRNHSEQDFEMVYFNSDGNPSSMCGNGGRCIVKFAMDLGVIGTATSFMAVDGVHQANIMSDGRVSLEMSPVNAVQNVGEDFFLDTGSPHYVKEIQNLGEIDIIREAHSIRYSEPYKNDGVNVNFVQYTDTGVTIRTYERGVEDETLACGTGVTAAAIVASLAKQMESPVHVQAVGGDLEVSFERNTDNSYSNIWKTGPAEFVFDGTYPI